MLDEVLADLKIKKLKTIDFQLWMFYVLCILYLRMFAHYFGQYIILRIMGVPVTQFDAHWYKIYITYAEWEYYQIFITLVFGCLFNTIIFSLFIFIAWLSKKKTCKCFPRIFYKVICWYGVLTLFDFALIFLCDALSLSWEQGDAFALYKFYYERDGTGLVGIYLTFFLYFGITVLNVFIFYNYMIFVHMNGRILDLYKRLNGSISLFFVPNDNEVSLKYVQWVVKRAKKKNFILKSYEKPVKDKKGLDKLIKFVYLYKFEQG